MGMYVTIGSLEREGILVTARQGTIAAAGSSQTDAATGGGNVTVVTGASGTNGVIIGKPKVMGRQRIYYSSAATNALLIYPPVGGTINNGSTNAAFSATARTPVYLTSITADGLTWIAK